MSKFEVPIVEVRSVEPIPGADFIELAVTNDYRSVVAKGSVAPGDAVAYIPEGSIMPQWLIEKMGLQGKLAGAEGNRVKAIRLRGQLSQGVVYPITAFLESNPPIPLLALERGDLPVKIGNDVSDALGIVKWEPPIPTHMSGEVCNIAGKIVRYDIENIKKFPDVLEEGEMVTFTEKLHGTLLQIGIIPGLGHPELFFGGDVFVTSKGLGGDQGLAFKDNDRNAHNLYVRSFLDLAEDHREFDDDSDDGYENRRPSYGFQRIMEYAGTEPLYMFGEIVGIQDLKYGMKNGATFFRLFDVARGNASYPTWLKPSEKKEFCLKFGIPQVPILYEGPWSRAVADQYVDGKTTFGGGHIREGIVITPENERYVQGLGRVILKHVSAAYLLRKGDTTEFN